MQDVLPALLDLATQPERITHTRLWRSLPRSDRELGIKAALRSPQWDRGAFLAELAENIRFRPVTLGTWTDDKLAAYAARCEAFSRRIVDDVIRELHLAARVPLLTVFLNEAGIPHENGVATGDFDKPVASTEDIGRASTRLFNEFAPNEAIVYLLSLFWLYPRAFPTLRDWLATHVRVLVTGVPAEERTATDPILQSSDPQTFTTLDRRLVRVVVDAAQGIDGAPTEDELDDLLEEVIHLNSERHRSFFHIGFRDAMFKRPPQTELAAENLSRREWYLSGLIQGLGRRQAWNEIIGIYDTDPVCRTLGQTARGAGAAARTIYRALCEVGRHAEGAKFLKPIAIATLGGPLAIDLLDQSKRLLRGERAADAKATLRLLNTALDIPDANVFAPARPLVQEVRRRLAHAHRQLGEVSRAKELLEALLDDPELTRRSVVLADLGILACGYRRLADLRIPQEEEDLAPFRETLEKGETLFRRALETGDMYTSHAHFCLGVLEFVSGRFDKALSHLDEAVSGFETDPDAYRSAGLLNNARLYLGLAICHALNVGRMEHAHELIRQACEDGAEIPPHLVTPTLVALEMGPEAFGRSAAEAILNAGGPGVLDEVAAALVAKRSQPVASRLLARMGDEKRGTSDRVNDGYTVLPLLLNQERHGEAEEVLDYLQASALEGRSAQRFVQLLDRPAEYEPIWTCEDAFWARLNCLESLGSYEEAGLALEKEFHRILADRRHGYLEDAAALIERIDAYALEGIGTTHLKQRLTAEQRGSEASQPIQRDPRRTVHILVVGGNETQAQYDVPIQEILKESHPEVIVDFVHTGWSSNWGQQLADIKQRLPQYDALVMMRLMRTMLGRRLRASLGNIPWRGCGGRGRTAILNSIIVAANSVKGRISLSLKLKDL